MPIDLHREVLRLAGAAKFTALMNPSEACRLGMDRERFRQALEWFSNPRFSDQEKAAREVTRFVGRHSGIEAAWRYDALYERVRDHGLLPQRSTRWQVQTSAQISRRPQAQNQFGHRLFTACHAAVQYLAFLQRALADIRAVGRDPEQRLELGAQLLMHRLWSAERSEDATLLHDLLPWLSAFAAWAGEPPLQEGVQVATLRAMSQLPSPEILLELKKDPFDPPLPGIDASGVTIDSSLLCFGKGQRFGAFASLTRGAVLLVDLTRGRGEKPWGAELGPIPPSEEKIASCLWPQQAMLGTAAILSSMRLLDVYGIESVTLRGEARRALLTKFHDRHRWIDATDAIGVDRHALPEDPAALIDAVARAYLSMAGQGFFSLLPQFFVRRDDPKQVRIAQLRHIYRMKSFPRDLFTERLSRTLMLRFAFAPQDYDAIAARIDRHVDQAVAGHLIPAGIPVVALAAAGVPFRGVRPPL